jgi:hypothetical protein
MEISIQPKPPVDTQMMKINFSRKESMIYEGVDMDEFRIHES